MLDILLVTRSLDALKRYLDPAGIPALVRNASFSFDYSEDQGGNAPRIYLLKSKRTTSIARALDHPESVEGNAADIAAARTFLVNELLFAGERAKEGNRSFDEALSCLSDASFTGLVIANVGAAPLKGDALGPASLVQTFSFSAPLVRLSNIDFSSAAPDPTRAHCTGYVVGVPTAGTMRVTDADEAGFTLDPARMTAQFVDDATVDPQFTCYVRLRRLFSLAPSAPTPLVLVGSYAATASSAARGLEAYRFRLGGSAVLAFDHRCLLSATIAQAASSFSLENGTPHLRLSCSGSLSFAVASESFDPWSFGPADEHAGMQAGLRASEALSGESGLAFSGLDIVLDLPPAKPALDAQYRSLTLDERRSAPRPNSFAACVPHQDLWFLCDQDGGTPEELGYRAISSPLASSAAIVAGEPWYGIVFSVDLLAGSSAAFLFAFTAEDRPSCAVRLEGIAGAAGALVPATSLFGLRFREIALNVDTSGEREAVYHVVMRGLKASVLGLQLPEGACDVALVAKQGAAGWYAAYESGNGE